jgi:DNA-binding NarL/FixJ family response regulator/signal transduction histidine kinase
MNPTPFAATAVPVRTEAPSDEIAVLSALAQELAGEFRLQPLLEKIIFNAVHLLGCVSGSICTIDETSNVYKKEVDLGVGCQAGQVFPLDEGVTGAVVRAGGTVVFDRYSEVPGGHIAKDDERHEHSVIGVPITLKSVLIGACVVFANTPERNFTRRDAEFLELFATHAAIAIANSRLHTDAARRAEAAAIASERERNLRDVHDTVGRTIANVMLHIGEAVKRVEAEADPLQELSLARTTALAALEETKRTALGLGPSVLDHCTLEEAISQELEWIETSATVRTQLLVVGDRRPMSDEVAQQLLRIVQEALANVVSHSRARSVRLGLVYGPDAVAAIIEDDGVGFNSAKLSDMDSNGSGVLSGAVAGAPTGFGLRGLAARARQVGGFVEIDSTPSWGTRVQANLPYAVASEAETRGSRWRVLVVHKQPSIRAGLVSLLAQSEPGIQVAGEIDDSTRALDAARLLHPDVVLADLDQDPLHAPDFIAALKEINPGIAVVFLIGSGHDERVRDAAQAGARGFVNHSVDGVSLSRAIISAANGDAVISGDLFDRLGNWASDGVNQLTTREREVRTLVERGLPDKQIAIELEISVKTVEKHVGTVLRKTGAKNRTMLAALAHAG